MKKQKSKERKETSSRLKGFSSSALTAIQYGFTPFERVSIKNEYHALAKQADRDAHEAEDKDLDIHTEEKIALLAIAEEKGVQGGQPLMTYRESNVRGSTLITLDVIGNGRGVSEALLLACGAAILRDAGIADSVVEINCIGDKDSTNRFLREIGNYYRKNIALLPPACRVLLKKDISALLTCEHEKCQELAESAPRSMNYLTEASRVHFQEVLEYLEGARISYTLSDMLLPTRQYCTHTVFRIRTESRPDKTIGYGSRWNSLSKKIGGKREISGVSLALKIPEDSLKKPAAGFAIKAPRFFFIHVGPEARLLGVDLIEKLRQNGIPVLHAIIKDKLSGQLAQAEESKVPYVIMMGQKECVEQCVIVRNTENRSQDVVKLATLPEYLKKL